LLECPGEGYFFPARGEKELCCPFSFKNPGRMVGDDYIIRSWQGLEIFFSSTSTKLPNDDSEGDQDTTYRNPDGIDDEEMEEEYSEPLVSTIACEDGKMDDFPRF
jgi:hypothetical protein